MGRVERSHLLSRGLNVWGGPSYTSLPLASLSPCSPPGPRQPQATTHGLPWRTGWYEKAFLTDHVNYHGHKRFNVNESNQCIIPEYPKITGHRFPEKLQHSPRSTLSCCKEVCSPEPGQPGYCGFSSDLFQKIHLFKSFGTA